MKKIIYSVAMSSLLTFAITGCKQGNTEEMMKQDMEKVSSSAQAKIDELNMTLNDECNTKIMEEAQKAFDAMPKTADVKKPVTKKPPVKPKPTTTAKPTDKTPPPNTTTGRKDDSAPDGTTTGRKDPTSSVGVTTGRRK